MSDITDALDALKTLALTINPTPQTSLVNGWVYPTSYSSIDLSSLPVAIVSRVVGVVDGWRIKSVGRGLHRWQAEILIPIAQGRLEYPSVESAAAEVKQDTYEKALADVLYQNMTLSGTVTRIGGEMTDGEFTLFEAMINHFQWNDAENGRKIYWGFRFVIPVWKVYTQTMGS